MIFSNIPHFNLGWNSSKLYGGFPKPSARLVSTELVSAVRITEDLENTHMLMQWGQFLDHDLDFTPAAISAASFEEEVECTHSCSKQSPCFPISIPEGDQRINIIQCLGFTRSGGICTSENTKGLQPRQQANEITSYIDASNVYGSSENDMDRLRDGFDTAFLRIGEDNLLPEDEEDFECILDPAESNSPCFLAGDRRVNEQIALISMHTLWMREHNRIAEELLHMNPHLDEDVIFEEARKIVGAEMQHITYTHWLPKIIGQTGMEIIGIYEGYNRNTDASILNEFATAAFRFGHTLVHPTISRLTESFLPIPEGNLKLHEAFFAPHRVRNEGGIDPILRGLIAEYGKMPMPEEYLNSELTEKLFAVSNQVALDLAALNIQRGRDHGLPSYNQFREWCGLGSVRRIEDLKQEIRSGDVREKLQHLYGHPGINIFFFYL